jgi:hypothetical protein
MRNELDNSRETDVTAAGSCRKSYKYTRRNTPWQPETIERLKDLWTQRQLSAAGIANVLGLSRNAVLGKVDRLHLPSHADMNGSPRRHAPPQKKQRRIKPPLPPPAVEIAPLPPVPFLGLTFAQLNGSTCHYPRGDDPVLFCGQPTNGASYCPYCHALTRMPLPLRQEVKAKPRENFR